MFWIDVFDTAGNRIGQPIRAVSSAKITRALDGAGSFSASVIATDERVIALLTEERRVQMYTRSATGEKRAFGSGVITKIDVSESPSGISMNISGPDSLYELARLTTKRKRKFTNQSANDVFDELLGIASWTREGSDGTLITARFDGANILESLVRCVDRAGFHFREGTAQRSIEIGTFGTYSGIKLIKAGTIPASFNTDPTLLPIVSIKVARNSEGVINRIFPYGSGEDESAITLKRALSSRATPAYPYDIQSISNGDGSGLDYYIEDSASVELYGVKEQYRIYKDIVPISNSETGKDNAANALYDTAAVDLQRSSVIVKTYDVTCAMPSTVIKAGDKVLLRYKGVVRTISGADTKYIDENDYFWVLKVSESYGEKGTTLSLTLSNIDHALDSPESQMAKALQEMKVAALAPSLTPFRQENTYVKPVQRWDGQPTYTYDAEFLLRIDDTITDVTRVIINFKTSPMFTYNYAWLGGTYGIENLFDVVNDEWYPNDISLYINGVDVTSVYGPSGGVWNPYPDNDALDVTCDITDYIVNASGGLQQTHKVTIKCSQQTKYIGVPGYSSPTGGHWGTTAAFGNHGIVEMVIVTHGTMQPTK